MIRLISFSQINTALISKVWRKKIPDVSGLVTTTILDNKIREVERKIPLVHDLMASTVFNQKIGEVEKKTPDVPVLVKETD